MNELETIRSRIHEIRGARVMLDFDLAKMYGVETKALNQAVKRNIERFPEDFMFQLTKGEWEILRSQIVTANLTENQEDEVLISQIATIKSGDNQENDALRSQIVTLKNGRGDQNDINESTRAQLDAISTALVELQGNGASDKPRRRIGFVQD